MVSTKPAKWNRVSALAQAILCAAGLSSCGRRPPGAIAGSPDAGFGGESWVAVENATGRPQREGQQAKIHVANGFLWWSVGLGWSGGPGGTRMVDLATGQQGVFPWSFQAMEGGEGFTTVSADPPHGRLTDIVAVDLASGRRRTVAEIGCNVIESPLVLDVAYVYFISSSDGGCGEGIFRVRRDGRGRPEFVGSEPSPPFRDFAVDSGYVYWSDFRDEDRTEIMRRRLEGKFTSEHMAFTSSRKFHIAEGRLYFVNEDAIWSVRLDGSEITRRIDVGPAGASQMFVDRGYLYWTNEREIRRFRLSGGPAQSSEVIADDETYRGQTNIATDGQNLCWYDLRQDRIRCLGRDTRSLLPHPRRVAKPVPHQRPPMVSKQAYSVFVGESWACANVSSEYGGGPWQCWEQPPVAGTAPVAIPARWMAALWPAFAADRVCAVVADRIRCWPGPGFLHQPPDGLRRARPLFDEGRFSLFLGGTFTCGSGLLTDEHKRPVWTCEGDNSFHQFAGFQTAARIHSPALGTWHACAVTGSQSLSCWGRGDGGQLGRPSSETCRVGGRTIACSSKGHNVPFDIPFGGNLLAGDMFTCVVSYKGLTCFGASRDGWFGQASQCPERLRTEWPTTAGFVRAPKATCSAKPMAVQGFEGIHVGPNWELENPHPISIGPRGACAIINDHVRCVGAIPTPSTDVTSVAVNPGNRANACGIADGRVVCWGEGYSPSNDPTAAVAVALYPTQRSDAAVMDFPASKGKIWPASYAIHRSCASPVQAIPKCSTGTTGEPWAHMAARASALLGLRITVRDRMVVGTWGTRSRPVRGFLGDTGIGQGSVVLGDGEPPLSLIGYDCTGDESRLCCNLPAFGQTVVATGTLGRTNEWFLEDPTICEINDEQR